MDAMRPHGAPGEIERVADHNVMAGVFADMGAGNDWPELRARLLAIEFFSLGTPIRFGQPSGMAYRALEPMDDSTGRRRGHFGQSAG